MVGLFIMGDIVTLCMQQGIEMLAKPVVSDHYTMTREIIFFYLLKRVTQCICTSLIGLLISIRHLYLSDVWLNEAPRIYMKTTCVYERLDYLLKICKAF